MGRKKPEPSADKAIAATAARQHGHITRRQLIDAGLSRTQIGDRAKRGSLIRIFTGVYAVGHVPVTPESRAAAAVLACGPTAALSHGSAAALWGIARNWPSPVEVIAVADRRPHGIRTHCCPGLARTDVTVQRGIRATSPARTLLDVAPRLSDQALARGYNDALLSRYLRPGDVPALLDRCPSRPGASRLAQLAADDAGPTRSELEDRFQDLITRYGLPRPQVNVIVAGYEVDFYFPEQRVIVELDGYRFHGDRESFEVDRERDAAMTATGHRTVRITDRRLRGQPAAEAARLRAILES